jgi:multiple RNA-binding domain-containing protein 1
MRDNPDDYADEAKAQLKTEPKESEWRRKMALAEKSEEFKEFLAVVQPRSKAKFWDNDAGFSTVDKVESKKPGGKGIFYKKVHKRFDAPDTVEDTPAAADDASDSDSEDEAFDNPMLSGGKDRSDDDNGDSESSQGPRVAKKELSDSQEANDLFDDDGSESDGEGDGKATPVAEEECVPDAAETARIFVRNLPYAAREDELSKIFSKYGDVSDLHMPVDDIGRGKGFALVQFLLGESAVKAMHELDGKPFQGRLLHILPAKPRPEVNREPDEEAGSSTYKKTVEMKRRREGQSEHNWNSLFLSSDAVAAAAAKRHGVSKSDIVGADADNVAVRMALAETQTIAETKAFLEENGVAVGAFDGVYAIVSIEHITCVDNCTLQKDV